MGVNRCICRNVPFAHIAAVAREVGNDLAILSEKTGCGTGCGMCLPYIKRMLQSGRTDVPVMTHREIEELLKDEQLPLK
ncbi:MAG: hypothetical protein WC718_05065 [Phycisphaerales bacterium]|jgi:bacterioferritin-associated ferredoxin